MNEEIENYRQRVYRFILQFVKDDDLADDLTQDVMIKIWSKYAYISKLTDIDNYILKIAKHHVIDQLKKLARDKDYQRKVWQNIQLSSNIPDDKLVWQDMHACLEKAVKRLPERQQEVFILNKHAGFTLHKIATTLGITVRTARNHLDRALKGVRNSLNRDSLGF
ncbi:MAG TPA: sigma-70 family RNA polymerase sigma factor [Agriterribacter sp.]|nr:sigma-70 family RNA polymerase sigma factor [Agriterribacter sp.]